MSVEHVAGRKQVADVSPDSKPGPARSGPARTGVSPGLLGHPKPAPAPMAASDNPYGDRPAPIDKNDPYNAAASAKPDNPPATTPPKPTPRPIDKGNPYSGPPRPIDSTYPAAAPAKPDNAPATTPPKLMGPHNPYTGR